MNAIDIAFLAVSIVCVIGATIAFFLLLKEERDKAKKKAH
jgi:hypothetical protein